MNVPVTPLKPMVVASVPLWIISMFKFSPLYHAKLRMSEEADVDWTIVSPTALFEANIFIT